MLKGGDWTQPRDSREGLAVTSPREGKQEGRGHLLF